MEVKSSWCSFHLFLVFIKPKFFSTPFISSPLSDHICIRSLPYTLSQTNSHIHWSVVFPVFGLFRTTSISSTWTQSQRIPGSLPQHDKASNRNLDDLIKTKSKQTTSKNVNGDKSPTFSMIIHLAHLSFGAYYLVL